MPLIFKTKSDDVKNYSMLLNKTSLVWAKALFITIKDLCAVAHTKQAYSQPFTSGQNLLYLYIWQNKIKQNVALPAQETG